MPTRRLVRVVTHLCAGVALFCGVAAQAAWFDAAWPFRREVLVTADADKMTGGEIAVATVLTNGRQKADGSDIRVCVEDGKTVPFRVLGAGPGDVVRVAFAPTRASRRYFVYFGNPNPPAKKANEELSITAGVLMEMRVWPGGPADTGPQLVSAFDRAKDLIGSTMVDRVFIGRNPFDERDRWITRFTAALQVPQEGDYTFAAGAKDRGVLVLDGKPILVCQYTNHARFTANAKLTRGRHEVAFFHMNQGGDGIVSLAWRKPGSTTFDPIGPDSFGRVMVAAAGSLEENRKTLTADFKIEYLGEAFFAGHFTHHYRFTANLPRIAPPKYEWDFGDGQVADGNSVSHIYLAHGVYPVKVTARLGGNSDTQTTRIAVARDRMSERIKTDELVAQSKLIENYKLDKLTAAHLPWATLLHQRAGRVDAMLQAAARLAMTPTGFEPLAGLEAMNESTATAMNSGRVDAMIRIWETVPENSTMQPSAAREYARLLVWRAGEFEKACKILAKHSSASERGVQRLYAHALVLNGRVDEGKKILASLPMEGPADRQAAIRGALARTVEYYIESGDAETGEEAWDKWQRQYPVDFLEGYSVLLRVRLIEARKMPETAAKVAEAFALAVPRSTYAPSLLDKASRLLATSNPSKSADLRKLLKQKYPEDPLSQ